jgi:hypothetical protein
MVVKGYRKVGMLFFKVFSKIINVPFNSDSASALFRLWLGCMRF